MKCVKRLTRRSDPKKTVKLDPIPLPDVPLEFALYDLFTMSV